MATYIFRSRSDHKTVAATDISLNKARDRAAQDHPTWGIHRSEWWKTWECWEGGVCIWYCDEDGDIAQRTQNESLTFASSGSASRSTRPCF